MKDGSQRIRRSTEFPIEDPNDLRKISAIEWVDDFLLERDVVFLTFFSADAAIHYVIADVHSAERENFRLLSDFRGDPRSSDSKLRTSRFESFGVFEVDLVTIDLGFIWERLEEGNQTVMSRHLLAIDHRGSNKLFIDHSAVLVFRNVAFRSGEAVEERGFNRFTEDSFIQLQCSRSVLYDLRRLDSG